MWLKEGQELLVPMPPLAGSDHLPGGDVQGGKQCRRAVPDIVVADASRPGRAEAAGSAGCGPAPAPGSSRRRTARSPAAAALRYSPTTSRTFSTKNGSVEKLERLGAVRMDPEQPQIALHRTLGNAVACRRAGSGPVRAAPGAALAAPSPAGAPRPRHHGRAAGPAAAGRRARGTPSEEPLRQPARSRRDRGAARPRAQQWRGC